MRFRKSSRFFWRAGGNPNLARVPKLKSKLIKLEQEISSVADRMADNSTRRRPLTKGRRPIATFFRGVRRDLVYIFHQLGATAALARKIVTIGIRAAPEPHQQRPAPPAKRAVPAKGARAKGASGVGLVLVSVCFGVLVLSGVIIALLFLQVRGMKDEISRWQQSLSATQAQLRQMEKVTQQKADNEVKTAAAPPRTGPISLGNDEMKAIRASIKVLHSKSDAQAKFRVGEEAPDLRSAPVPESLTTQIPKLRGARFAIDDNGAIILFAEGSNSVGAVIEPQ
jgi:hypothetical protein